MTAGLVAYRVMTVDPAGKNLYAARYRTHGGDIRTISSVGVIGPRGRLTPIALVAAGKDPVHSRSPVTEPRAPGPDAGHWRAWLHVKVWVSRARRMQAFHMCKSLPGVAVAVHAVHQELEDTRIAGRHDLGGLLLQVGDRAFAHNLFDLEQRRWVHAEFP